MPIITKLLSGWNHKKILNSPLWILRQDVHAQLGHKRQKVDDQAVKALKPRAGLEQAMFQQILRLELPVALVENLHVDKKLTIVQHALHVVFVGQFNISVGKIHLNIYNLLENKCCINLAKFVIEIGFALG